MAEAEPAEKDHVAQLFGRDSLYMLIWAVQIIVAALLTPITTRVLGLAEFGTITSANAVMQVLFVFAGLGLQTAVQREYSTFGNPRGAHQLIFAALALVAGISTLAWYTIPLWAPALEMGHQQAALRWAVLWAGSSAMTTISLGMLRSLDKLAMFGAVSFIQSVVAEALALGLVKLYRPTAELFLGGQVAAQFVAAFLGLVVAPPALLLRRDGYVLARAFRFALPLVPAALSTFVLSVSDRLIVEAQMGSEAVARYQVAYNVASMPMLLLSVLNSAWMPRFFGISDEAERRTVLASSRDALYRLMLPVVVGFACGAPLILRVWAPASYHPEHLHFVVCLVLITAIPYAGQLAVTRTLMAEGRTLASALVTLLAAVLNVVLNIALVPSFGLEGCAFATLAAYVFLYVALEVVGRAAKVPPSPMPLRLQLAGAATLALASAWVDENALTLTLRAIAGAATVVWFVKVLLKIGNETKETNERTKPARAARNAPTEVIWTGPTIEMSAILPDRRLGRDRRHPRSDRPANRDDRDRRHHRRRQPMGRHRAFDPDEPVYVRAPDSLPIPKLATDPAPGRAPSADGVLGRLASVDSSAVGGSSVDDVVGRLASVDSSAARGSSVDDVVGRPAFVDPSAARRPSDDHGLGRPASVDSADDRLPSAGHAGRPAWVGSNPVPSPPEWPLNPNRAGAHSSPADTDHLPPAWPLTPADPLRSGRHAARDPGPADREWPPFRPDRSGSGR